VIWLAAAVEYLQALGMDAEFCDIIHYASPMHDVGKIAIPDAILLKPGKFEPHENPLCKWCDFQPVCPLYRHRYERVHGDPAPRMSELVDEWVNLKREGRSVNRRLDELNALINAYCEEHDYGRLFASDGSAVARRPQHVTQPDEKRLHAILEPLGLWEQVLSVDTQKLNALIESRSLPPDVEDAVLASREEIRTQYALYLREQAHAR